MPAFVSLIAPGFIEDEEKMSVTIRIPGPLRRVTNGQSQVSVDATTVAEAIDSLDSEHEGIKDRICDETGDLRYFVNV